MSMFCGPVVVFASAVAEKVLMFNFVASVPPGELCDVFIVLADNNTVALAITVDTVVLCGVVTKEDVNVGEIGGVGDVDSS
jgi:hypothetical protein